MKNNNSNSTTTIFLLPDRAQGARARRNMYSGNDLSGNARSLYLEMLSNSVSWKYTIHGLADKMRFTVHAIRKARDELLNAGFLYWVKTKDPKGYFNGVSYFISEVPFNSPEFASCVVLSSIHNAPSDPMKILAMIENHKQTPKSPFFKRKTFERLNKTSRKFAQLDEQTVSPAPSKGLDASSVEQIEERLSPVHFTLKKDASLASVFYSAVNKLLRPSPSDEYIKVEGSLMHISTAQRYLANVSSNGFRKVLKTYKNASHRIGSSVNWLVSALINQGKIESASWIPTTFIPV